MNIDRVCVRVITRTFLDRKISLSTVSVLVRFVHLIPHLQRLQFFGLQIVETLACAL
jgi:hypothetical protein